VLSICHVAGIVVLVVPHEGLHHAPQQYLVILIDDEGAASAGVNVIVVHTLFHILSYV
jgi:hypothetical protein